ncbi:unnamed protein product [Adineta ricciae]|uniref:Arginine deiminase n=1 Tax=Adineta ricciae TaxID=249248 RepID=A0A815NUI9_ADIRI|nr:unnamed protein product [Adineta ricciae]
MCSSPILPRHAWNKNGVGVQSECGKLDVVLMHRPGQELRRLTKTNIEQLLFDAVPDVNQTQKSHDAFVKCLRTNGVHVLYMKDLLTQTLVNSYDACQTLIDGIISNYSLKSKRQQELLTAVRQWLGNRTAKQLADDIVHGVTRTHHELGSSAAAQTIFKETNSDTEFIIPPLPNLLFSRDAFSVIEKNVFIWNMAKPARRNEPLIYRVIFQYHPQLSTSGLKIVEWQTTIAEQQMATVEGGDVAYLGQGILMIGCGERTNRLAIEALARTGVFEQIIAVMIPPQRDYMHLDTVLSSVGKNAFTLHGPLAYKMDVFTVETHDDNNNKFINPKWILYGCDVRAALRKLLNNNSLRFYDAVDEATSIEEQRECRHNVVAIDDYHVVTYAGGNPEKGIVNQMTRNGACSVDVIPSQGLLEGGGGAHCMTNAIRRRSE